MKSTCMNWMRRVHHYVIRKQEDGRVNLEGSKKRFIGPIELIMHHRKKRHGLVTKLTSPCARPPDMPAPYFWFRVTIDDFNDACFSQVMTGFLETYGLLQLNSSCSFNSKARFQFKRNRLRCVNENRKRLRWQAANHGCHRFDQAFLLAGACVCFVNTQALAFLAVFVYVTHATQAIAFEWKPGLTLNWGHEVIEWNSERA